MGRLSFIKRRKVYIPFLVVLLAVAVLTIVIKNMAAPAVGDIDQTPPARAEKTDPYGQPGSYKGKYVSFNYPAHYKKSLSKLTGTSLEVVDYHATDSTGKTISVSVYRGNTNDDSNIAFRRQHKELYTENDTQKWLEFTKKDGTEDTFFLNHSGLETSVAFTAPYSDTSGDGLYVASSLKWL